MFHHAGAMTGCFEDGGLWQARFFMVQPVGIMMEDFVIWMGRMVGVRENGVLKMVGFLWVGVWFSWCLRFMVAFQTGAFFEEFAVPSLVEWVMGRKGIEGFADIFGGTS